MFDNSAFNTDPPNSNINNSSKNPNFHSNETNQTSFPRGQPDVTMLPNNFKFSPQKNHIPTSDPDLLKQSTFSHNIFHFQGNSPPINPFTPPKCQSSLSTPSASPISPIITSTEFNISKFLTKRLPKRRLSSSLENSDFQTKKVKKYEEKMSAFMQDLTLDGQYNNNHNNNINVNNNINFANHNNNNNNIAMNNNYNNNNFSESLCENRNEYLDDNDNSFDNYSNETQNNHNNKNNNFVSSNSNNNNNPNSVNHGINNSFHNNNNTNNTNNNEKNNEGEDVSSWYPTEEPRSVKNLLTKISDNQRLEIMDGIRFEWKGNRPPSHLPPHLVEHIMKPGLQLMLWKPPGGGVVNEIRNKTSLQEPQGLSSPKIHTENLDAMKIKQNCTNMMSEDDMEI